MTNDVMKEVSILVNKVDEVYAEASVESKFALCYLLAKREYITLPNAGCDYISKFVKIDAVRFLDNFSLDEWRTSFKFPSTTNRVEVILGAMQHYLREYSELNKSFFSSELAILIRLLLEIQKDDNVLFLGMKDDSLVSHIYEKLSYDLYTNNGAGCIYTTNENDVLEAMVYLCQDVIEDMQVAKHSPNPCWFLDKDGKRTKAFTQEDMFAHIADVDELDWPFNKAFLQPSFGKKVKEGSYKAFLEEKYNLYNRYPCIKPNTDELWLEALLVMEHMPENGIAWMLVNNNALTCKQDEAARKYMLEKGYIECVISLPPKFMEGTAIRTSLVGMRKCHHEKVRFIDAMGMCVQGRRQNDLDYKLLEQVIIGLSNNLDYTTSLSYNILKDNEFRLAPEGLMTISSTKADCNCSNLPKANMTIADLVKIKRTVPITAKNLDDICSNIPTGKYYMRLGDIKNGMINERLAPINVELEDYKKYWLEDQDVLLSKLGTPDFKTAIVEINADEHILPIGNIYILRPDKLKINPYFLKAYLDSVEGREQLNNLMTGDAVAILTALSLKKMVIPMPDPKQQEVIGQRYKQALNRVRKAQEELDMALEVLQNCANMKA